MNKVVVRDGRTGFREAFSGGESLKQVEDQGENNSFFTMIDCVRVKLILIVFIKHNGTGVSISLLA